MPLILFLCTGNYYRSRHAEIYFNAIHSRQGGSWRAISRGLALMPENNPGPIAQVTIERLQHLGIPLPDPLPFPQDLCEADLASANRVVAVKEAEHRPLMMQRFPDWTHQVEYWHVHDIDCALPEQSLPQLEALVSELSHRLHTTEPA